MLKKCYYLDSSTYYRCLLQKLKKVCNYAQFLHDALVSNVPYGCVVHIFLIFHAITFTFKYYYITSSCLQAHHEKLVVVDQSYAFVGGIDLCYGR